MKRRTFITSISTGLAATTATAGCLSNSNADPTTESDNSSSTTTQTDNGTTSSSDPPAPEVTSQEKTGEMIDNAEVVDVEVIVDDETEQLHIEITFNAETCIYFEPTAFFLDEDGVVLNDLQRTNTVDDPDRTHRVEIPYMGGDYTEIDTIELEIGGYTRPMC